MKEFRVRLLGTVKYGVFGSDLYGLIYKKGVTVPVIPATNLPYEGAVWINTEELKDDPIGLYLLPDEYELVEVDR